MERAIGEVFQDGEVTLKVVEEKEFMMCKGCHYRSLDCSHINCISSGREDKTSVIFVKQD